MQTILLVDDDPQIRHLLTRFLKPQGYELIEAASAEAALQHVDARGDTIAAVVCDLNMPGEGGEWLVHRLRERARSIAIVLATANAEVSPTVSLRDGVVAYVVKPFSQRAVVHAVREAVRWHDAQRTGHVPEGNIVAGPDDQATRHEDG